MSAPLSRRQALSRSASAWLLAGFAPGRAQAASITPGAVAAQAVLTRLFGAQAAKLALTLEPNTRDARPWYAVESHGGEIAVRGDTPVALARGAYAWLKQSGAAHVSWEGDRVAWPERPADYASGRVESPFAHRAYLNTCTYGYTTP